MPQPCTMLVRAVLAGIWPFKPYFKLNHLLLYALVAAIVGVCGQKRDYRLVMLVHISRCRA